MTISLVAVFIPVFFMGGIIGRLLHEFAVTIGVSILISGFVSLTLTPMLAAASSGPTATSSTAGCTSASERFFNGMLNFYERTLPFVLRHRFATMLVSASSLLRPCFLFKIMPTGFLPSEDTGALFITTEGAQGISFDSMKQHQLAIAEIVLKDPNVEGFMSSDGAPAAHERIAGSQGRIFIKLKPRSERKLHVDQVIQKLRPKLAQVPGIQAFPRTRRPSTSAAQLTKSLYQFTLQSPDTGGALRVRAQARGEIARAADAPGRDQRPADQEPADQRGDRP